DHLQLINRRVLNRHALRPHLDRHSRFDDFHFSPPLRSIRPPPPPVNPFLLTFFGRWRTFPHGGVPPLSEVPLPWPDLPSLVTDSTAPPAWLITDLFYQSSLICLAGVPGVGKSLFSYAAAIAVASGRPFLGLSTKQTRVLYFDEENGP